MPSKRTDDDWGGEMDNLIQHGYLVLADISGYTSFVEETELDHGPKILRDLTTLIIDHLTPALQLAEVEGDAVFVYVPAGAMSRGELLLEVIEATYVAFRNRQRSMKHNSTCPCKACQSVAQLDLKFVTHYGPFVLQEVAGKKKPVGSCVNVAHRLLKNRVSAATGWKGYALFSEASLEQMGIHPQDAHRDVESYEHLGEFRTASTNLDARYLELVETHRDVVGVKDADVVVGYDFQAPVPVVWDWLNDPHKRALWFEGSAWAATERPAGRTGQASQNHCANSGVIEYVLDWRPFEYYTVRLRKGKLSAKITGALEPAGTATHLQWSMTLDGDLPRWLRRPCSRLVASGMRIRRNFERMDHLIAQTASAGIQDEEHGAAVASTAEYPDASTA